jgi:hypothetical protein
MSNNNKDDFRSSDLIVMQQQIFDLQMTVSTLIQSLKTALPLIPLSDSMLYTNESSYSDIILKQAAAGKGTRGSTLYALKDFLSTDVIQESYLDKLPSPIYLNSKVNFKQTVQYLKHHFTVSNDYFDSSTLRFDGVSDLGYITSDYDKVIDGIYQSKPAYGIGNKDLKQIVIHVTRKHDKCKQLVVIESNLDIRSYLFIPFENQWYFDPNHNYLNADELHEAIISAKFLNELKPEIQITEVEFKQHLTMLVNSVPISSLENKDLVRLDVCFNPNRSSYGDSKSFVLRRDALDCYLLSGCHRKNLDTLSIKDLNTLFNKVINIMDNYGRAAMTTSRNNADKLHFSRKDLSNVIQLVYDVSPMCLFHISNTDCSDLNQSDIDTLLESFEKQGQLHITRLKGRSVDIWIGSDQSGNPYIHDVSFWYAHTHDQLQQLMTYVKSSGERIGEE